MFTWQNFYKIIEHRNWFLLYQSTNLANMIPKTQLSQQQINEIRWLLQNVPVKNKKLKK
ncbi:YcxB family protein [Mucilaginibacter roseus]|uniref:YcxB family protein n=1 Tax=Mucilaginibacter roseus TaxID=1528868 RepID=UPI00374DDE8F